MTDSDDSNIPGDSGCALCSERLSGHSIREGSRAFCCTGCHAVFNILSAKNQLAGFEQHPIFQQALRSGLISNPALLEMIRQKQIDVTEGEREKLYLEVGEMWCPSCAEVIKLMLLKEKGVLNCVVDYSTDMAAIEYCPRYISRDEIVSIIKSLGYEPLAFDREERKAVGRDLYLRFGIAAFCALNAMMFAYPLYATYFDYDGESYGELFAWLSMVVTLPVVTYCSWPIWKRFYNSLMTGLFGMETLVFIGVTAAFTLSSYELFTGGTRVYFDSMAVIIVFVLLGKIIEAKAKFSAKESLKRLSLSTPRRGRKRFADGTLEFVLVKEIAKGDIIEVYTGEKVSLDGCVTEGYGACDESLMTGEAIPVTKEIGSLVLGGTILIQGRLCYRVTGTAQESALQRIINLVEKDIGHKSVYVRAADIIVRWFVPAVILIALLVGLVCYAFPAEGDLYPAQSALLRALAVLLISCPCAIGIAAPTAESHLLHALASIGAIVRNRGCLNFLGKEQVIVLDKTGTITEGRFRVQSGLEQLDEETKQAVGNLTALSMHPVSCAISQTIVNDIETVNVNAFEEVIGNGIKGQISGIAYALGSDKFMEHLGVEVKIGHERDLNAGISTRVYIAKNGLNVGMLSLEDKMRSEIPSVVKELSPAKVLLLSGDAENTVAATAKACGITVWRSRCTPLMKREIVESFKKEGNIVCMVGDGINDAPALTSANVGISVVSATDMSIQVSDLLLTTSGLGILPKIRALALKGHTIVRQNLFWAFFFNVIGIGLAAAGVLSPIFAAFAMSASSLAVLFNAKRL